METSDLQNIHATDSNEMAAATATEAGTTTAKRKYTRRAAGKNGRKVRGAKAAKATPSKPRYDRIFSLDIGTRSVIGIVAERIGLAAGMASNIVPCVGLVVFAILVAKLPEE